MNCKSDRKKELKERYYFDCDCFRCQSDTVDRYHYAAKCPTCQNPIVLKVSSDKAQHYRKKIKFFSFFLK